MKKPKRPLSKKLHVAIRQAVRDLLVVAKDPRYEIDMENWHCTPMYSKRCHVCLGGCAIVRRTNTPTNATIWPDRFPNADMLNALDSIRCGWIDLALKELGLGMQGQTRHFEHLDYSDIKWEAHMLKMADYIENNQHRIRKVA